MLEEYIRKNVIVVIGTNSGISTGTQSVLVSGVIIAQGTIEKYDENFVKLENVKIMRNKVCDNQVGWAKIPEHKAIVDEYSSILIERSKIITIMVE